MNGQVFANLVNLKTIFLTQNGCINKFFIGDEARKTAIEKISTSCGFDEFDSKGVVCERFEDYVNDVGIPIDSCLMVEKTAINASNFVIADLKDDEIEGIVFEGNLRIEFLPYKIYMQFSNLDIYMAGRCSIKQISKENFENLHRLKHIDLSFNQIQKISTDTFKQLGNLMHISLSESYKDIVSV